VDVALSACSETNCGVLSILMSKWFRHLAPEAFSLTELLQRQGYEVFQILSGWHGLRRAYGHDQTMYFDGANSEYGVNDDRSVFEGLRRVPAFHGTPAFFHFHLMSVHVVGDKQTQFRRYEPARAMYLGQVFNTDDDRLASSNNYDNGILQADAMIQDIFAELGRKGYLANSVVVVVADHGEGLGEHGLDKVGHSVYLYQEYIRIPLLIYDDAAARYRSLSRASQVDVAPTVVDRLGLPVPRTWEGRSLLDESVDRYTYHQTGRWEDACYAVTSRYQPADFKYIRCNAGLAEELYDLAADPMERNNLMSTAPAALVEQFSDTLRAHLTGSARR
jgi:membrane-anchored protein YejM (alkaline phosphatase superfamily)